MPQTEFEGIYEERNWFPNIVTQVTPLEKMPLYLQAAKQTGFSVTVLAEEGQQFTHETNRAESKRLSKFFRFTETFESVKITTTIEPGNVVIAIEVPKDHQGGHAPFWKAYGALNAALQKQKS